MKKGILKTTLLMCLIACFALCAFMLLPLNNKTVSATADVKSGYTFEGYSLRFDETSLNADTTSKESAFRFRMKITNDIKQTITGEVKTGTLIFPAYYLNGSELTVDSKDATNNEIVPINIDTTNAWKDNEDGTWYNLTHLKEIPSEYYSSDIAVRGYYKDAEGNYSYTDWTNYTPRSFAWVVNEEYRLGDDSPIKEQRAEFRDAFNKFTVKVYDADNLSADPTVYNDVYYGSPVTLKDSAGLVSSNFTSLDGTHNWAFTNTVTGNVWLKRNIIDAKQYYSATDNAATFDVTDLTAGVTTATLMVKDKDTGAVTPQSISCTTEAGKLTVEDLTTALGEDAVSGETYLIEVDEKKVGFTYVKDIVEIPVAPNNLTNMNKWGNEGVPAFLNGLFNGYNWKIIFEPSSGFVVESVTDLTGESDIMDPTGCLLTSLRASDGDLQESSYNKPEELWANQNRIIEGLLTGNNKDVYRATIVQYPTVFYTAEQFVAFFLGEFGKDDGTGKIASFVDNSGIGTNNNTDNRRQNAVAIGADIDVTTVLDDWALQANYNKSAANWWWGYINGFGHTVKYATTGANSYGMSNTTVATDWVSYSILPTNFYYAGLIKNVCFDVTINSDDSGLLISGMNRKTTNGSGQVGGLDNVVFDVTFNGTAENGKLADNGDNKGVVSIFNSIHSWSENPLIKNVAYIVDYNGSNTSKCRDYIYKANIDPKAYGSDQIDATTKISTAFNIENFLIIENVNANYGSRIATKWRAENSGASVNGYSDTTGNLVDCKIATAKYYYLNSVKNTTQKIGTWNIAIEDTLEGAVISQ